MIAGIAARQVFHVPVRVLPGGLWPARDTGVRHDDVQPAPALDRRRDGRSLRIDVAHVTEHGHGLAAGLLDQRDGLLEVGRFGGVVRQAVGLLFKVRDYDARAGL
jgi:hypothetical protein